MQFVFRLGTTTTDVIKFAGQTIELTTILGGFSDVLLAQNVIYLIPSHGIKIAAPTWAWAVRGSYPNHKFLSQVVLLEKTEVTNRLITFSKW